MANILNNSGIYKILNIQTGDYYIGSAVNLRVRKGLHFHHLRENKHHSTYMQRAYNKYGGNVFEFITILICDPKNLLYFEQLCIDKFKPVYNICKIAGSSLGVKRSQETKRKISDYLKNHRIYYPMPESEKEKRRVGMLGKKNMLGHAQSEETKKKISNKALGNTRSARFYKGFISPNGEVFSNIYNLADFCREHSLCQPSMRQLDDGRKECFKGWRKLDD